MREDEGFACAEPQEMLDFLLDMGAALLQTCVIAR